MSSLDPQTLDTLLAEGAVHVEEIPPGRRGMLSAVVPAGYTVQTATYDTRDLADRPATRTGTVHVHDVTTFAAYWLRHAGPHSEVYADVGDGRDNRVTAILDGHGPTDDEAGWGQHRIVLRLTASPEWAHWVPKNGRLMVQADFAEHIEAGLAQIVKPAGSNHPSGVDMLQVAQSLQGAAKVSYESSVRLSDGQVRLSYVEDRTSNAGSLEVPAQFTLELRPWSESLIAVHVVARFRHRFDRDGGAVMGYALDNLSPHLESAANNLVTEVSDALAADSKGGPTVWRGQPRQQ